MIRADCLTWISPTHTPSLAFFVCLPPQRAKEDASHAAKSAAISAETAADSAKHEAKGFGARLWGRGQVRDLDC
jgi:hypothetical protein